MKHCMIDLETLGTETDSVFLSIAAVPFDLNTGEIGEDYFRCNISLESALKANRKIYAGTLQWWLEQRPEIMKLMFKEPFELEGALIAFKDWWYSNRLAHPWGNSASFDIGMLGHAFNQAGMERPWKFYNERCYRTAFEISGLTHFAKPKDAYDPLVDCRYQISELARTIIH